MNSNSKMIYCFFCILILSFSGAFQIVRANNLDGDYVGYMNSIYESADRKVILSRILDLPELSESETELLFNYFDGFYSLEDLRTVNSLEGTKDFGLLIDTIIENDSSKSDYGGLKNTFRKLNPRYPLGYNRKFSMALHALDLIDERSYPIDSSPYSMYKFNGMSESQLVEMKEELHQLLDSSGPFVTIPNSKYLLECYLNQKVDLEVMDHMLLRNSNESAMLLLNILKFAESEDLIQYGISYAKTLLEGDRDDFRITLCLNFLANKRNSASVQQFLIELLLDNPGNYYKDQDILIQLLADEKPDGINAIDWQRYQVKLREKFEANFNEIKQKWN